MPLMPKRVKYRKPQRGKIRGRATKGNKLSFGEFGIQAMSAGFITSRQIEAARVAARHYLGGSVKMWIRIFPHKAMTSTPAETRMGKGKGEIDYWTSVVKPGTILFEVSGCTEDLARHAFRLQSAKYSIRTRFVKR